MKPTETTKKAFREKHAAVLTALQEAFPFQPEDTTLPELSLPFVDQVVLDADRHGGDFHSMRESQIDREINHA